jgi:hypothetical protein
MTVEDEVAALKSRIQDVLNERLDDKPAILLSELGVTLGSDLGRIKLLTGKRLTDFVTEQFSGIYRVARIPNHGNAYVVVPASASDEDVAAMRIAEIKPKSDVPDSGPRFRPVFWAAFSKPVTGGRRFLSVDPLEFMDVEGPPVDQGSWYEITPDLIPDEGIEGRDVQIAENIQRWLSANGLSADPFKLKPAHVETAAPGRRITLLQAVISCLDLAQQRQISLPLDVVKRLSSRTVTL